VWRTACDCAGDETVDRRKGRIVRHQVRAGARFQLHADALVNLHRHGALPEALIEDRSTSRANPASPNRRDRRSRTMLLVFTFPKGAMRSGLLRRDRLETRTVLVQSADIDDADVERLRASCNTQARSEARARARRCAQNPAGRPWPGTPGRRPRAGSRFCDRAYGFHISPRSLTPA
jgi:hypothetical protein